MQEEGYIPSDALKLDMAQAFEQDGKPVPFQVHKGKIILYRLLA